MTQRRRLLFQYLFRYPFWACASFALGFAGALFNGVGTALVVPLVLGYLGSELDFSSSPPIIQKSMSVFEVFGPEYQLFAMTGAVLLLIFLKNATTYVNSLVTGHLARSLASGIRREALDMLLNVDVDFFNKNRVGDILNRIGREVDRTSGAIRAYIELMRIVCTILTFVALLVIISWELTLAASTLMFLVALSNQYFVIRSKAIGKLSSEAARNYSVAVQEILNGIRLVKALANEREEKERLDDLIEERERTEFQSQVISNAIAPINEMAGIITVLAIVAAGSWLMQDRLESISESLLAYLLMLFRMLPLVGQLNSLRSRLANAAPSVEIVSDFLDRSSKPFMPSGTKPFTKLERGVHFCNISFAYPQANKHVLEGVNLHLPKGTTLALVGGSGSGKSTMANLLGRFYDLSEGKILIDGMDIREFDLSSLRRSMGIVSQDTFLFNDSVRRNISYGRENATEEQIVEAAKRANAYEFVMQLPQGFDTQLGDRGVLLSGGQRQRIGIARALFHNPDVLILDEATSALDTVSERLVQQAIDELSRDRTTLVIAHRLSTVQNAEQIAVLDRGRVVEVGAHDSLLQKNGPYARLHAIQFDKATQNTLKIAKNEAMLNISFKVRTRLTPIIGYLNLLVDSVNDPPEERHELLVEAYQSAVGLLENMEALQSKAEANQDFIEKAKHNTMMNVSYEVRTRLTPTIGYLDLLMDVDGLSPQDWQESMDEAYDSAMRLLKTLEFLEDSARVEIKQSEENLGEVPE